MPRIRHILCGSMLLFFGPASFAERWELARPVRAPIFNELAEPSLSGGRDAVVVSATLNSGRLEILLTVL